MVHAIYMGMKSTKQKQKGETDMSTDANRFIVGKVYRHGTGATYFTGDGFPTLAQAIACAQHLKSMFQAPTYDPADRIFTVWDCLPDREVYRTPEEEL